MLQLSRCRCGRGWRHRVVAHRGPADAVIWRGFPGLFWRTFFAKARSRLAGEYTSAPRAGLCFAGQLHGWVTLVFLDGFREAGPGLYRARGLRPDPHDLNLVESKITASPSLRWTPSPRSISTCNRAGESGCARRCCCSPLSLRGRGGGETAIQLGAVVEMVHAATLVHDDVIDAAQTRRGRPSTNVSGAITLACWRATGSTCRRFRWLCASVIFRFSIC